MICRKYASDLALERVGAAHISSSLDLTEIGFLAVYVHVCCKLDDINKPFLRLPEFRHY
jgi:hypothetical protein